MATQTVPEQIGAFEAARMAKAARMDELMTASAERGETLDEAEEQEYDELQGEVESIDKHLKRLHVLEKTHVAAAKPVPNGQIKTIEDGSAARAGTVRVRGPELPQGIRFARIVKCLGVAQGNRAEAARIAEERYPDDQAMHATLKASIRFGTLSTDVEKAAVAAGTTTHATWASPLVSDEGGAFADFVEFLRPMTILGKFGTGGIPGLRRVPFRTPLIGQTTGGQGYWVGESAAKPLTQFSFARTTLLPLKVANIAVITEELLRDSSPSADAMVRDSLAAALVARLDLDFIDPTKVAVNNVSPASITNGVAPISASGTDGDAVRATMRAVFGAFLDANNAPTNGVWIMSNSTALALSLMTNALGQPEFPGITMTGGNFAGLPVITSEYVSDNYGSPSGGMIILANASDIYFADDGGVSVDMSREASLQMDDAPGMFAGGAGSPDAPIPQTLVSLWQTNSVGFRAERTVNWSVRRPGAVQVIQSVLWGT